MNLCKWMRNLDGRKKLFEFNIPGTHDSCTKYVSFGFFASCQSRTVTQQLEDGVRILDIRVKSENDNLYLVHGACSCKKSKSPFSEKLKFDDVLNEILGFIKKNPSETILLMFKKESGKRIDCFEILHKKFINQNSDMWFTENRVPTLDECRGKIVLMRRSEYNKNEFQKPDDMCGIDITRWKDQGSTKSSEPMLLEMKDSTEKIIETFMVQDRYYLPPKKKWREAIMPMLQNSQEFKGTYIFNFFSTTAFPIIPKMNAKTVNKAFKAFKLNRGAYYGTVFFDGVDESLAKKIIETNI